MSVAHASDERSWCDTCESWRITMPCGRDECPAPNPPEPAWKAAEAERRLIVRYIREVGAQKHPGEATTQVSVSAARAHFMDRLATAIEFERHIPTEAEKPL